MTHSPWAPTPRALILAALGSARGPLARRLARALLGASSALALLVSSLATPVGPAAAQGGAAASGDPRFFDQTQFRVDRDAFWDFFQKRGGVRTFGFPASRSFLFMGCTT